MKQETIDKLTEKALSYLNSVEAFTAKEVPEYLRELLEFKFFEHLMGAGLLIIGFFILLIIIYKCIIEIKKIKYIEDRLPVLVLLSIPLILSLIVIERTKSDILQAYKAKKAPRVYLVDYLRGNKWKPDFI